MSTRNDDDDVLRAQLLDDDWLRIDELCSRLCVEQQWIVEMVELGALDPSGGHEPSDWAFPRRQLPRVLAMTRLVTDLGVNLAGAAIILDLVEERRRLLSQLHSRG
jgi:chaperone modulatory protein CbpM